jgi:hypothetical protein
MGGEGGRGPGLSAYDSIQPGDAVIEAEAELSDCLIVYEGYHCTRDANHDGQHVAEGVSMILATWDDDGENFREWS